MIWSDIPGFFDWPDIYDEWATRCTDESVIVEVGCWQGRSTAYLATKLKELGKYPRFRAVDSWEPSEVPELKTHYEASGGPQAVAGQFRENLAACGVRDRVFVIEGRSTWAAERFYRTDFCFIDADHAYESVLSDLRAWSPKIRQGGQMAGHDMTENWPGVRKAVEEFFGNRWRQQGNCWVVDF